MNHMQNRSVLNLQVLQVFLLVFENLSLENQLHFLGGNSRLIFEAFLQLSNSRLAANYHAVVFLGQMLYLDCDLAVHYKNKYKHALATLIFYND